MKLLKSLHKYTATQNGNAIVLILVAIALFAALSYAFSNSSRTSTGFVSDEEAKAYAHELVAFGNDVATAIKRLKLRGCDDTEISFENSKVAGYNNPSAPTDKSCNVFDSAGGGLQLKSGPAPFKDSGPLSYEGKYFFSADETWQEQGTDCTAASCADLIMIFYALNEKVCSFISNKLGYTSIPQVTAYTGSQFTGAYSYVDTFGDEVAATEIAGKSSACFLRTSDSQYIYAHLLIAR